MSGGKVSGGKMSGGKVSYIPGGAALRSQVNM